MRCIETSDKTDEDYCTARINYNMRCIETAVSDFAGYVALDKLQHEMY